MSGFDLLRLPARLQAFSGILAHHLQQTVTPLRLPPFLEQDQGFVHQRGQQIQNLLLLDTLPGADLLLPLPEGNPR